MHRREPLTHHGDMITPFRSANTRHNTGYTLYWSNSDLVRVYLPECSWGVRWQDAFASYSLTACVCKTPTCEGPLSAQQCASALHRHSRRYMQLEGCYHGVFLWYVTMVCYYGMLPWCVATVCYHGVLLWRVTMVCCYSHGMLPWSIAKCPKQRKRNPCSLSAATLLCTFVQAVNLLFQVTLALTAQVGAAKDQQHSTCDATLIK